MADKTRKTFTEKYICFTTNNQRFSLESAEYSKVYLLNTVLLLMAAVTLFFTIADALLLGLFFAAVVNFISFIISMMILIYFHKTDNLEKAGFAGAILLFLTLMLTNYAIGSEMYNLFWSCIFPLGAYSILGNKQGCLLSSIFFGYLLLVLFLKLDSFTLTGVLNIVFAYLAIMVFVSYNEKSKSKAFSILEEKNYMLDKLTITDTLTGLGNRLLVEKELGREIARAERSGTKLSIIILDLNKFKQINDTLGHLVGDKVLIETARLLQKACREADLIARWGGDEFLIICPETDLEQAKILVERISKNIARSNFEDIELLNISFGIAEHITSEDEDSLFKRADDQLYFAKKNGYFP